MRDDQLTRLPRIQTLANEVMDAFLDAADPANWAGVGKKPAEMTPDVRGARNWDVKNANQVGALTARILDLRDRMGGAAPAPGANPDDAAEADVAKYEKQAKELLKRAKERYASG